MRAIAVTFALLILPHLGVAHHSLAEFERTAQRELEGEVVRVQWSNPHIRLTLKARNEQGGEEIWQLTGFDLNSLDRRNVPRDLVHAGDVVRVSGSLSNRREQYLYLSNLLAANGTEILISPTAQPLWSRAAVVGLSAAASGAAVAAAEGASIFRVWSRALGVADSRQFPFTPAAIAARSAWNPDDNFATRCEPEGMPRIMTNPHPFEFVDRGDTIALRSELYDLTRLIHIGDTAAPADQPESPLGYSVGHWEGGALIVETTRVSWPYFDNQGTPQSPAARFLERFAPSEDGSRLSYRLTITDPATFTEPAVYERIWLALGEQIQPYACQVY